MKRTLWLSFLLLLSMLATAQTVTQQGVAYRYNGRQQRTPLGRVTITYDANKRSTVSSDQDGTFSLLLDGHHMGDRIGQVTVKKREMMVFNQQAVDEWSVRKEPLMLILCNADEFEKQKENLINIGRREAKKKYDKQKAELEAQLSASKIRQQEYEATLDKAYEELERLNENIGAYADLFARIDESEVDTLAQQALTMFSQGQVDEAVRLFEQGNYMEKLDRALHTSQQADALKAKAEEAKEKAVEDSLKAIRSLVAQVNAYTVQGSFHKAGEMMKGLADRISTVDYLSWYAEFCGSQQNYAEAEAYWRKTLAQLDKEQEQGSEEYLHRQAVTLRELGTVLGRQKEFDEAEEALTKAVAIHRDLCQKFPARYERVLASSLNDLGNFYENTKQYQKAIDTFQEVLDLDRIVAASDSAYERNVAVGLNNLALVYKRTGRFLEARDTYLQAKEIQHRYTVAYPKAENLKHNYSGCLANLANVYMDLQQYDLCEEAFKEAVRLSKELTDKNPDAYLPSYCLFLSDYARFMGKVKQFEASKQLFAEAIPLYRQLDQTHPRVYSDNLARTLLNYGILCTETGDFQESETALLEAYGIRKKWAQRFPKIYNYGLCFSLEGLVVMAGDSRQFEKGEQWGKELVVIARALAEENPVEGNKTLSNALMTVGNLYGEAGRQEESISCLKESAEIRKRLAADNAALPSDAAQAYYNLGITYVEAGQWENAEEVLKESLALLDRMAVGDHDADKADTHYWLGRVCAARGEHVEAVTSFLASTELIRRLAVSNPQYYQARMVAPMGGLSYHLIFLKKYAEAERYAREALTLDPSQHWIATNLAAALLFQGNYAEAEQLYRQYKDELKEGFLGDLKVFDEEGAIPKEREEDVERIRQLLNE